MLKREKNLLFQSESYCWCSDVLQSSVLIHKGIVKKKCTFLSRHGFEISNEIKQTCRDLLILSEQWMHFFGKSFYPHIPRAALNISNDFPVMQVWYPARRCKKSGGFILVNGWDMRAVHQSPFSNIPWTAKFQLERFTVALEPIRVLARAGFF